MSQNYDPNNPNNPQGGYGQPPADGQQPQGGYGAPPPYGTPPPSGYGTPPPAGYQQPQGYQQTNYQAPDMNKAAVNVGNDLAALPQKWLTALTKPSTDFFAREMPNANWTTILVGAGIAAVVSAIFSIIRVGGATGIISGFIGSVIGLLIGSGILYLIATTIGKGRGNFMVQTYLYSLFSIPISLVSSVLGIIPVVGSLLGIALSIYSLYLTYLMLQPAHNMNKQSAQTTVIVLFVIGLVIGILLLVVFVGLLATLGLAATSSIR